VQEAVDAGAISRDRWASYTKLQREAQHHAREADSSALLAQKRRWKAVHKAQKRMYRERER
jgi:ribosome biogenesis GTPase